jgi:hypothetical protein
VRALRRRPPSPARAYRSPRPTRARRRAARSAASPPRSAPSAHAPARAAPISSARAARADVHRVRMHCKTLCAQRIRGDLQTFAAATRWPRFPVTAGMLPLTPKQRALRLGRAARHTRHAASADDDAEKRRRTVRAAARCNLRHFTDLHALSLSCAQRDADKRRLAALHLLYELRDDDDYACDGTDAAALLPAGFANLGNTCFISAATQLLMHPLLCCLPSSEQQGVTLASCAMQAALRAALGLRCGHETLQALACALPQGFGWHLGQRRCCHHPSRTVLRQPCVGQPVLSHLASRAVCDTCLLNSLKQRWRPHASPAVVTSRPSA